VHGGAIMSLADTLGAIGTIRDGTDRRVAVVMQTQLVIVPDQDGYARHTR
jgi:hypothetical protein